MTRNVDGAERRYLQIPYFPSVTWNPDPKRCFEYEMIEKATEECAKWGSTCTKFARDQVCEWIGGKVTKCPGWNCSIEGQKCTDGPGYICRSGRWRANVSRCPGWDCDWDGVTCSSGYTCSNKRWVATRLGQLDALSFDLASLFNLRRPP